MVHDHNLFAPQSLPVTYGPRYPWYFWAGMLIMAVIGLLPFLAAGVLARSGVTRDPASFLDGLLLVILMGTFVLAFPLLAVLSRLKGWPRLHIDTGLVHLTTIFGRVQVLHLSDYAAVTLGESLLGKGYQPVLEAVPMDPRRKLRTLPLRPFVHSRSEAEALVALIRRAGGDRPPLTPAQDTDRAGRTRREWLSLAAIIVVSVILLVLLKSRDV